MTRYTDYDTFAEVYNRHWGGFATGVLEILDKLGLDELKAGDHVVDVCCGTGQLAAELIKRKLRVTGIDGSAEMVRIAAGNAPGASFVVADAREFRLEDPAKMALSTYDSLNHVTELADLAQAFRRVADALEPGGRFVFDLNMEAGFQSRWHGTFVIDEADELVVAESSYDPEEKLGVVKLILLERAADAWIRKDLRLTQRAYPADALIAALEGAGFESVAEHDAADLMSGWQAGRSFFVATKPA